MRRSLPLSANRLKVCLVVYCLLGFGLFLAPNSPVYSCEGKPPPPRCGKTLVLSQAAPPVILLPGGGTFDIPVTVYFSLFDFPTGSGICPPPPGTVDITMTVTCDPAGDGVGELLAAPIGLGYTDLSVPVTLPAGPPRLCTVDGVATASLDDGMVLTATSDSVVCLAEPAPEDPSLPRLDMVLSGGAPILKVHPGDQAAYTYRITNNDPVETFSGLLGIEMLNSSRLPGMSGPAAPGTGVFSISDPGLGDNFPIGFPPDLVEGCLPLPPDPSLQTIPFIETPILLPPGEFIDIDAFARPWGMCTDGSCSRAKVVVDGMFSDTSPGKACSGFVSAADVSVPPLYLWPDSGQTAFFQPPLNPPQGLLTAFGEPFPGLPIQMDLQMQQPILAIDGGPPLPLPPQLLAGQFDNERGRIQVQFQDPKGLFLVDSFFDIAHRLDILPTPGGDPFETEMFAMDLVPGAPVGFENTAPFGMGQLGILLPGDPDFAAFGQLTYQLSGFAVDDTGVERELIFNEVNMAPTEGGMGIEVLLNGTVAPGTGTEIVELTLFADPRLFLSQELGLPEVPLFADGFESGDTSSWSNTVP